MNENIMTPKVSVIVPVYGVERYIERCARSLFEQTLDDIEFLFIDDCSLDKSVDILKGVLEEYPHRKRQVIIHRMDKNSGQAAVRKWGMLNAKGQYIIHCDSDDWVDPQMYQTMYEMAIKDDLDMVRCNFVRTNGVTEIPCVSIPTEAYKDNIKLISYTLIGSSFTSLCDKIIRRELVQNNSIIYPEHNMQEDAAILVQVLYNCKKIGYISKPFYKYCFNESSISRTQDESAYLKRLEDVCSNTNLIMDFLEEKGLLSKMREEAICRKYHARTHIIGLVNQKRFYDMWWTIYPEIDGHILFNKKMRTRDKIEYFSVKFKFYSLKQRIRKLL